MYLGLWVLLKGLFQGNHEGWLDITAQHGGQAGAQLLVTNSHQLHSRIANTGIRGGQVSLYKSQIFFLFDSVMLLRLYHNKKRL